MSQHAINILLIEDNEGDILLTQEALEECKIQTSLETARDGCEALHLLITKAKQDPKSLPDIILLDINLPKKNGYEVLESVKNHPDLKHIPVIMLTTSSSESDIRRAYQEHANCYVIKPLEINEFIMVTSKIEEFWMTIAKLPKT